MSIGAQHQVRSTVIVHEGSSFLEHLDFLEAVRGSGGTKVSFADGMLAVAMGVAAHRSITEQRPVLMSEVL